MADCPADVVLIDAFENAVKFGNALFRLGDFTLALLGLFLRFLEPLLFYPGRQEDWRQPGCSIYSQKMDPESKNRRLL